MNELVKFQEPRLPYHPVLEERFGVTRTQWKALVEAVYPAAKTPDAVVMALAYCQARNLDPFKKPVHIVPVWDSTRGAMVETVWPGISELRTTAMRTKQYAGCDEVEFGPDLVRTWEWTDKKGARHTADVRFPEWARMTVYRYAQAARIAIVGPKVFWEETYASLGKSDAPNEMWRKRPRGQIEKCAEAAALRRAFPEELGDEPTAEEMEGREVAHAPVHHDEPALTAGLGEGPKSRARKAKDPASPQDTGEPEESLHARSGAAGEGNAAEGEVQDAEFEDAKPGTQHACEVCGAPSGVECKPECRSWDELAEIPEHILLARQPAKSAKPNTAPRAHAEPGEVYLLDGEAEALEGGRQSYRDGKPYAPVTPDGVAALPSYSGHAPPPTATGSAPAAEPEPATSETVTPASGDGAAATSSPTAPEPPTDDGVKAPRDTIYRLATDVLVGEDGRLPTYLNGVGYSRVKANAKAQPPVYDFHADAEEPEEEAAPPAAEVPPAGGEPAENPLGEAFGRIKAATNYLGGKQVLKAVAATEAFKAAPEPMKAKLREALWDLYGELKEDGKETIEIHEDLALMRGFLEFGATSVAEIDAIWPVFWKRGAYKAAGPGDQAAITDLMVRRKAELKGGA